MDANQTTEVGKRAGLESLNRNPFDADFRASSHIPDANLRVFLSKVRPELRRIPVNAGRTVPRMSEGALPFAKVGTREGETFTRHGRGSDFQGLRILQH